MLDALHIHGIQLVNGNLVGNGFGHRCLAMEAVFHLHPAHICHRIQPVRCHCLRHDNGIPGALEKGNAIFGAFHTQQYCHHVVGVLGLGIILRLQQAVRLDIFRFTAA